MNPQIVSFSCTLKDKIGNHISSSISRNVLTAVSGEPGFLSGLSRGLQSLSKGETRSISLTADEAYGFHEPKKVILFPRKKIPQSLHLAIGQAISIVGKTGEVRAYKVLQIHGDMICLDGNHPLAGQDLVFEIEALEARNATQKEIFEARNLVAAQLLH